ncbi:hypothetical protein BS78_03G342300 [Paspalum vaginatum]|nr:hypothetical protein BS78_03G342300 [Paspalum vaginatum]
MGAPGAGGALKARTCAGSVDALRMPRRRRRGGRAGGGGWVALELGASDLGAPCDRGGRDRRSGGIAGSAARPRCAAAAAVAYARPLASEEVRRSVRGGPGEAEAADEVELGDGDGTGTGTARPNSGFDRS